jgi:hypothetical protein
MWAASTYEGEIVNSRVRSDSVGFLMNPKLKSVGLELLGCLMPLTTHDRIDAGKLNYVKTFRNFSTILAQEYFKYDSDDALVVLTRWLAS